MSSILEMSAVRNTLQSNTAENAANIMSPLFPRAFPIPNMLHPPSENATSFSPCPPPCANSLNVIVTGGSSGIGAAIVEVFAKAGHRVLFTYFTGLDRATQLQARFPNVSHTFLDQGDMNSIATFSATVSQWSNSRGVDVLINNAALGSATVINYADELPSTPKAQKAAASSANATANGALSRAKSKSTLDVLQRAARDEALMRVNSLGPLWITDALSDEINLAAYRTSESKATILFLGSVGGGSHAVFPEYCAADAMSKAATTYLSKHLAAKYVQEPIDVMCLSPGATETDMFRQSTLSKVSDPQRFIESMPKRKLIDPNDIATSVLWLTTQCPKGLFHGANLDASMGLAVRPGLQTETEHCR